MNTHRPCQTLMAAKPFLCKHGAPEAQKWGELLHQAMRQLHPYNIILHCLGQAHLSLGAASLGTVGDEPFVPRGQGI